MSIFCKLKSDVFTANQYIPYEPFPYSVRYSRTLACEVVDLPNGQVRMIRSGEWVLTDGKIWFVVGEHTFNERYEECESPKNL